MKQVIKSMIFLVAAILFSGITQAAPVEWNIDKAHSNFYFDIRHIFSTIRGGFDGFTGKINIDSEKPEASSVTFDVEVKSVNTGINQRDNHLRTMDFFDAGEYPLMKFKSTSVKKVEGNKYVMTGDFTIKDVKKTIEVPFTYLGVKDNPSKQGELVAGFDALFTIDRLAYNVGDGKFYKMGLIDKDVKIFISLELTKKK
ncbi:MAG: YceI family protein [Deltaproteobacteria bacterium]|nr:YceI family protein [Deltaproteobacteria bacterium]